MGSLVVRKGVLTSDKFAGCERIKVPARVIFYNAKQGYAGPDHVIYEVTSSSGEVATYDVTITVKQAPAPNAPGSPKTGTAL